MKFLPATSISGAHSWRITTFGDAAFSRGDEWRSVVSFEQLPSNLKGCLVFLNYCNWVTHFCDVSMSHLPTIFWWREARLCTLYSFSLYRLQINIQCGPATNPRDDVALHLSLRPKEACLVRNHWRNRAWGTEERYGNLNIRIGQPFDILVLAEYGQYKIAINGAHFCTFTHRIPLDRVRFVDVSGGHASIHYIGLEGDTGPTMPIIPPTMPIIPPMMPSAPVMPIVPAPGHGPPPYVPPHGGIQVLPIHPPFKPTPPPFGGPHSQPGGGSKLFIETEVITFREIKGKKPKKK